MAFKRKPKELDLIEAIEASNGNISAIARAYGVSRKAVYDWFNSYLEAKAAIDKIREGEQPKYDEIRKTRKVRERKSTRFVYLVQETWRGYCKIGVAKDVTARFAAMQSSCPQPLTVLGFFETNHPYIHEQELHDRFSHKHERGEWFSLDENDIRLILEYHNAHTLQEQPSQLFLLTSNSTL